MGCLVHAQHGVSSYFGCVQGPWLTRYYLGLRKRPSVHRTLGPRANAAVDLNTPVLQFRDQARPVVAGTQKNRDGLQSVVTMNML